MLSTLEDTAGRQTYAVSSFLSFSLSFALIDYYIAAQIMLQLLVLICTVLICLSHLIVDIYYLNLV